MIMNLCIYGLGFVLGWIARSLMQREYDAIRRSDEEGGS